MSRRYRIWFDDGTSILKDALSDKEAVQEGIDYLDDREAYEHGEMICVERVECCRRQTGDDAPLPKCYRIWFTDGSAILRDAESIEDAIGQGSRHLDDTDAERDIRVKKVECLSD